MTDYFALLDEPRRPWLDPESLKQKYLALSNSVHPDRVSNTDEASRTLAQERSTELNAAYHCLREPRERLRHLLELELGRAPKQIQEIPSSLMDLSLEVGKRCRQADLVLAERDKATSPLLKAQLFTRGQEEMENLQTLQRQVIEQSDRLTKELKELDARWPQECTAPERTQLFERLETTYRLFSYFVRWNGQIQERISRLFF